MKRILIFVMIISMIFSVSCNNKNNTDYVNVANNIFSLKEISTNLDISYVCNARYVAEKNRIYIHGRKNGEQNSKERIFCTSPDFSDTIDITPKISNNEKINCFDVNSDGNMAFLTEKSGKYQLHVNNRNIAIEYDDIYVQSMLFFDNGNVLMIAQNYIDNIYNMLLYDGYEIKETKEIKSEWLENVEKNGNNAIITYYENGCRYFGIFNTESMTMENTEKLNLSGNISRLTVGHNEKIYIYNEEGIFEKNGKEITDICIGHI